jgi:hypothetical protein
VVLTSGKIKKGRGGGEQAEILKGGGSGGSGVVNSKR